MIRCMWLAGIVLSGAMSGHDDATVRMTKSQELQIDIMRQKYCGPIALYVVNRLLGGEDTTIRSIAKVAGTTEQGTSMLALKRAAEAMGLHGQCVRLTPEELLGCPHLLIVPTEEWIDGSRHFLVVAGSMDAFVHIVDMPNASSFKHISDFTQVWGGEALVISRASLGQGRYIRIKQGITIGLCVFAVAFLIVPAVSMVIAKRKGGFTIDGRLEEQGSPGSHR